MINEKEKSQETRKDKEQNTDAETSHIKDRSNEEFDSQEERIRDMSYIHRDMQMTFLRNKKEIIG